MEYVLCLVVVASTLLTIVNAATKAHHSVLYTTTAFTDGYHTTFVVDNYGQLASFSNKSVAVVRGRIYEPTDDLFSCSDTSHDRSNTTVGLPQKPFVVFLPLSECPYKQARTAEDLGAVAVVFHSDGISEDLEAYHAPLKVVVSLVLLTDHDLHSLRTTYNFTNMNITVRIKQYSTIPRNSQTFYFVVFAFSILVLLSLAWFFFTYARRCYDHYAHKRRRNLAQRRAIQTIRKLPTKKYKEVKTSDSDSLSSLDEPTCAVCLDSFKHNDCIRELPCNHEFHQECIDPWLKNKGTCPLCKYNIIKQEPTRTTLSQTFVTEQQEMEDPRPLQEQQREDESARQPQSIPTGVDVSILASMV